MELNDYKSRKRPLIWVEEMSIEVHTKKPKLYLNNKLINPEKMDESIAYSGQYFDFNMTNKGHKGHLTIKKNELLNTVDNLPLHPKNKILLH